MGILIWLGSGLVSIFLMAVLTGKTSAFSHFLHFMMPNVVIIITAVFYSGLGLFKEMWGVFRKRPSEKRDSDIPPDKKYGRAAIPVSIILYGIIGFIMGMFWREDFVRLISVYLIVGAVWGYCVYLLFQKGHFDDVSF